MLYRRRITYSISRVWARHSLARWLAGLAAVSAGLTGLVGLPASAQAVPHAPRVAGHVTVDYIVPTRDAQLFLEVVHPTDAAGHVIPAPVILTYTPYAVLGRNT